MQTSERLDEISDFQRLRIFRYEYSDDIPGQLLESAAKYKVRSNWWFGVISELESMQEDGKFVGELEKEVLEFIRYYTSPDFQQRNLTTAEDIEHANAILDKVLKSERT